MPEPTEVGQATAVPAEAQEPTVAPSPTPDVATINPLDLQSKARLTADDTIIDAIAIDLTDGGIPDLVASTQNQYVYAYGLDGIGFRNKEEHLVPILAGGDMDRDGVGDVFLGIADQSILATEVDMNNEYFVPRNPQFVNGQIKAITTLSENDQPQLLVGTDTGEIISFNVDSLPSQLYTHPGSANVTQFLPLQTTNSTPLLIAGYGDGLLNAISLSGESPWAKNLSGPVTAIVHTDFKQDGLPDIVAGDQQGTVLAVDAGGRDLWPWQVDPPVTALLAMEDWEDSNPVIIVGSGSSAGQITALDDAGIELWQTSTGSVPTALTGMDLDGNGRSSLIVGTNSGDVLVYDQDGNLRARTNLEAPVSQLMIIDSGGSTGNELFAVSGPIIYSFTTSPTTIMAEQPAAPDPAQIVEAPTEAPTAVPVDANPVNQVRPHYDILVDLDYAGHSAVVTQTVTVPNNASEDISYVMFHAAPLFYGFIDLQSTKQLSADQAAPITITPTITNTMIHLDLPTPLPAGETADIQFNYSLSLPFLDSNGWGPRGNAGYGPNLIQMGDWYPSLVPYNESAGGWQTWDYVPVGDPVRNELADFSVQITTDPTVSVAAPGYLYTNGNTRTHELKNGRAFAFLASPNYVYLEGSSQGIPVRVYVLRENQDLAPVVLDVATKSLSLFQSRYDFYPHNELVIAENGFLTAMEYSSIISLSGFAFNEYNGTAQTLLTPLIAHEVSHQYWYSAVGNDQVFEPWLDESLAMLAEMMYYETYHPDLLDWWWQYRVHRWNPSGWVDASIYDYSNSPDFVHDMYSQSAYFMEELRNVMGVANFNNFLRAYYQQHKNQIATTDDFFELAQTFTNADLAPLVDRYFEYLPESLSTQ